MLRKILLFFCAISVSMHIFAACEVPQPETCEGIDCGDHGSCINGTCICTDGYSGENCEILPPKHRIFVYGTIADQDGWEPSSLTDNYAQPDSFAAGTVMPGDQDDRGESIVGTVLPETGEVHVGDQAWWFKRGYDSPGTGTPVTPILSPAPEATEQGFYYSVWFKAADPAGDGSMIMIAGGNLAGDDRSSNYVLIENLVGSLQVSSSVYSGPGTWDSTQNILVSGLDTALWHRLEASMVRDGNLDKWTYTVDGTVVATDEIGYFSQVRANEGWTYEETVRVKFQPKHANYNISFQGFFFDDLETRTINSSSSATLTLYYTGFE